MLSKQLDLMLAGGLTKRYHTIDTVRQQNVAEHTFFAMSIALVVYDKDTALELLPFLLVHDITEAVTGDLPATVKKEHNVVKLMFDNIEHEVYASAGISIRPMPDDLRRKLKVCDYLEGMLYCAREIKRGNMAIVQTYNNFLSYVETFDPQGKELEVLNYIQEMVACQTPIAVK